VNFFSQLYVHIRCCHRSECH